VVGERWTLLVLRDCFMGLTRFDQFAQSTGVTRHVLSDRLKKLVAAGVLERRVYAERPKRYEYILTARGRALSPALTALRDWGRAHRPIRRPVAQSGTQSGAQAGANRATASAKASGVAS